MTVHAFNHRYDDGDSDKRLKEKYVKGLDSGSESDGSAKKDNFREGDKVTARYRGLEKYYKGVIRRAHSDGTFSIDCRDAASEVPSCTVHFSRNLPTQTTTARRRAT